MNQALDDLFNGSLGGILGQASELRNRAIRLQETALAALQVPTAPEVQRLEARLRALQDRVARLEAEVDKGRAGSRRPPRRAPATEK